MGASSTRKVIESRGSALHVVTLEKTMYYSFHIIKKAKIKYTAMKKVLHYLSLTCVVSFVSVLTAIAQPTLDFIKGIGGTNDDYGTSVAVLDSFGTNIIYATGVFRGSSINFNPGGTTRAVSSTP